MTVLTIIHQCLIPRSSEFLTLHQINYSNMPKNKGNNAGKKAQSANANLKGSVARTRRADRPAINPLPLSGGMRRITSRLSWPADDCTTIHVRATRASASSTNTAAMVIALDPTNIAATGYTSLGAISPLVLAMSNAYSRFMVTKAMVKVTLTTPITNGGFVGLGYTPDNTNHSGQPTSIQDATSSVHSDVSQVGESAIIRFDASDYFVDWRPTKISGVGVPDNQCGVVQWFADSGASTSTTIISEVDCVVHFAGFRLL